jgi:hypothetical protein
VSAIFSLVLLRTAQFSSTSSESGHPLTMFVLAKEVPEAEEHGTIVTRAKTANFL